MSTAWKFRLGFLSEAWSSLAWPYWASDEKWTASRLLAGRGRRAESRPRSGSTSASTSGTTISTTRCRNTIGRCSGGNSPSFGIIAAAMITLLVYQPYSAADIADPLAAVADKAVSRRLAGQPRLLPHTARPDGDRQPRPAHLRRPRAKFTASISLALSLGLLNARPSRWCRSCSSCGPCRAR